MLNKKYSCNKKESERSIRHRLETEAVIHHSLAAQAAAATRLFAAREQQGSASQTET
jgi:hypothetical protein